MSFGSIFSAYSNLFCYYIRVSLFTFHASVILIVTIPSSLGVTRIMSINKLYVLAAYLVSCDNYYLEMVGNLGLLGGNYQWFHSALGTACYSTNLIGKMYPLL